MNAEVNHVASAKASKSAATWDWAVVIIEMLVAFRINLSAYCFFEKLWLKFTLDEN